MVTNIAELCRRHGVSFKQFYRWNERFLAGGRECLDESSGGNEYQKKNDDLERLLGDQALVIDILKKSTGKEIMINVNILKEKIPLTRLSRALNISRSTIYYSRNERSGITARKRIIIFNVAMDFYPWIL